MSKIDRLLDEVWAETDTDTGAAPAPERGASARLHEPFVLSVMEAVARRRLRADLAIRFAVVAAFLAVACGLAPVVTPLVSAVISAQGEAALNGTALLLAAALSIGFAAQRWLTGRVRF